LQVARDKVENLEEREAEGKPARGLTQARERVAILEQVVAIQGDRELRLWGELWASPQAVMWERQHWTREVALYVRWQVLAESGDLNAAKEARQWSDRLGLTPQAMLRLRWEIVGDLDEPVLAAVSGEQASVTNIAARPQSRRSRLS
jgi:hypothetical protein